MSRWREGSCLRRTDGSQSRELFERESSDSAQFKECTLLGTGLGVEISSLLGAKRCGRSMQELTCGPAEELGVAGSSAIRVIRCLINNLSSFPYSLRMRRVRSIHYMASYFFQVVYFRNVIL